MPKREDAIKLAYANLGEVRDLFTRANQYLLEGSEPAAQNSVRHAVYRLEYAADRLRQGFDLMGPGD